MFVGMIAAAALWLSPLAHEGLDEQIAALGRRIELAPRDASLYVQRAELHRMHRAPELALVDIERASEVDPGCEGLELARGRALFDSGALAEAEAALTRHLERRPSDGLAWIERARVRTARAQFALADADYAVGIAALPQPKPEHFAAHARLVAGLPDVARALAILDAGQARLGVNVALQTPAIELEITRANWDAALERIDTLARQSERRESWLAKRGDVLDLAGRRSLALEAWRAALGAIESLPSKPRHTRATVALENELRAKVAR